MLPDATVQSINRRAIAVFDYLKARAPDVLG